MGRDSFIRHSGLALYLTAAVATLFGAGCAPGPHLLPDWQRSVIDRHVTEYPAGFELKPYLVDLDSPTGFCWDNETGNLIVAEGGFGGDSPHIFAVRPDGTRFNIYPRGTRIPIFKPGYHIYGPIGGIVVDHGKIFVSHRDEHDMGMITAFGYDGSHTTVIANLPAQGDYCVTDLAVSPVDHRLYFGIGATTNSGVVGLDNWQEGWIRKHRLACDMPYQTLNLLGYRFDADNPESSIFAPSFLVTVPFEPFGVSDVIQIAGVEFPLQKPTGCILSVSPDGGDPKLEAWGVRDPVGLAIDEYNTVYFTDQGMELRGTRPINKDPDALYQLTVPGSWFGWPDYSRSLEPVTLPKYQPPASMVIPTGYPNVGFVIDHDASKLPAPDRSMLRAQFDWQSGASKMAFIPKSGPFHKPPFEGQILVALWGDHAPFSTSGLELSSPLPGYRIVRVDPLFHEVKDFIYNAQGGPASTLSDGAGQGIERPIDVKFGPDGGLYILDFGRARMRHGHLATNDGSGKIFVCEPAAQGH